MRQNVRAIVAFILGLTIAAQWQAGAWAHEPAECVCPDPVPCAEVVGPQLPPPPEAVQDALEAAKAVLEAPADAE